MDAEGGAGGKQLRPRRRVGFSRTPYDRPLVGRHAPPELRNPNCNGGGSWFSKLLSPIANGAGRLLSSVFRRQEPAETSSSYSSSSADDEDENSSEEELEDNVQIVAAVENRIVTEARKQSGELTSVGNEKSQSKLFEIEQVLAGKTFTRDEFIHLTELLQSRIVDSSGSKVHGATASTELLGETYLRHAAFEEARRWSEERRKEREESGNGGWDSGLCGNVSRLALSPDVLHEASSSPADIAKAYMGTQHTWSSSPLSLQSHLSRDEAIQSRLKSLLAPRTTECWSDSYRTPTPTRMLNRMQSLAYSPYAMSDHSQTPYNRAGYSQNSFQMLKRRSSVIDDSWASVGTIRRTRQKSFGNVSSFSTPFTGFHSSTTDAGSSIPLLSSGLETGQNTFDKKPIDTDKSNNVLPPSQVKEDAQKVSTVHSLTAQKILEPLDGKLPPKENSSEEQITSARDESSSQPTMNLINCDSDVQKKYKDNGNTPLLPSTALSLEKPSSSVKCGVDFQSIRPDANKADLADASVFEKRKDQGLENEVHGSKNDTILLDVQTSNSVSSASDVSLRCNANRTFKFVSENPSTGPVLSCTTSTNTKLDTSKPNFDFKFGSKPELLFSSAVEAAGAFASNSQSTSDGNHSSISQSNSAGSIHGLGSNSAMASEPFSRFMFSTPLLAGSSSVRSTGSSIFGTPFPSASGASFGSSGFGKSCAFVSGPAPSFNPANSGALAFGSASKTLFSSTTSASFGTRTAHSSSSTYSFGLGANFGSSAMIATSGSANSPTSVFGSSTSSLVGSGTSFCLNSVTPLKSSSTPSVSFGTRSHFGSGSSSNGVSNQTSSFKEHVEVSPAKSIIETTSVEYNLGVTSLPSTEFASSCGMQKTMSPSVNVTSALGAMPIVTALVDATNHCQTTGNDIEGAAKSSSPSPSVIAQQSSLMPTTTSVTLIVDSQSNTQSTGTQPGSPSQNPSVSGAQTAITSVGHNESTVGSFPGNSNEKHSRRITRSKRDKTRRK